MTLTDRTYKVFIAGVGGQGAVTAAQLVMGAAWHAGYHALQSEVHGMSQRGGAVNAQILFDKRPVSCPIVMEGDGDLLIGLEPLESLRYLQYLKQDARLVVSTEPVINMDGYPEEDQLIKALESVEGTELIDTKAHAKTLENKRSGNMVLLGKASNYLPIDAEMWKKAIAERFKSKGEKIVEQNIKAFEFGRGL